MAFLKKETLLHNYLNVESTRLIVPDPTTPLRWAGKIRLSEYFKENRIAILFENILRGFYSDSVTVEIVNCKAVCVVYLLIYKPRNTGTTLASTIIIDNHSANA